MNFSTLPLLSALALGILSMSQQAFASSPVEQKVLSFAESHLGARTPATSAGECTDLVTAALAAAGAQPGNFANAPFYTWGRHIVPEHGKNSVLIGYRPAALHHPQPGCIIQFENCRFQTANSWNEFPQHSAIIEKINGKVLTLLHQNVNGNRTVMRSELDLSTLVRGTYQYFAPIARS